MKRTDRQQEQQQQQQQQRLLKTLGSDLFFFLSLSLFQTRLFSSLGARALALSFPFALAVRCLSLFCFRFFTGPAASLSQRGPSAGGCVTSVHTAAQSRRPAVRPAPQRRRSSHNSLWNEIAASRRRPLWHDLDGRSHGSAIKASAAPPKPPHTHTHSHTHRPVNETNKRPCHPIVIH